MLQGIQTMEVSQMTNQLFINNEFVESKSNDTMEVINPATGEAFDTITFATEEEVNEAIENLNMHNLNGKSTSTNTCRAC